MADSMLDFGKVANLALGLNQIAVGQERNRLTEERNAFQAQHYEQQTELQENAQQLEAQKLHQQAAFKGLETIDKVKQHPSVAMDRTKQVNFLKAQVAILGQVGVNIPLGSDDELMGGYEAMDQFVKTVRNGTQDEKIAAGDYAMVSNPGMFSHVYDDMKKNDDLSTHMEELKIKMDLHKTQLQALNQKNAKTSLQQNFYAQHVSALGSTSSLATDPRFAEHLRKIQSFTEPKAQQIYKEMHPDFTNAWEKKTQSELAPIQAITDGLKDDIDAKWDAIHAAETRDGQAPKELVDEVSGYESVYAARQAQAAFLVDPYNRQNFKNLKSAEANVQVLNGKTGKQLSDIADQRTQIMQTKLDNKQQTGLAESALQESFINRLNQGNDDNQSLGMAIKDVRKQFPGVPFDATKILNPNKTGKLEHKVTMPSDVVSKNLQKIDNAQSAIDYTGEIIKRIEANPSIVGKGGKIASALAGAGQQLRTLLGQDPDSAPMLNTKPRDEVEAFQELLTYMTAKSMDPAGALDIKVVQHTREGFGDINAWTMGPAQMLNKLRLAKSIAENNMLRARKRVRSAVKDGGFNAYLEDDNQPSASPTTKKPVAEMSFEESMAELAQTLSGK